MNALRIFGTGVIIVAASLALAEPTATLTLESSKNGLTVSAGAAIDWTVKVSVSADDNAGLALVAVDLVQAETNPAFLDLLPGDVGSIDALMQNFNRPDGISNPGEGGAPSGYVGVQRGEAGHMNLIQIGGGQNTFGWPGPSGIGEDVDVNSGVGQSGSQIVLSGSFPAPSAGGVYTYSLENGLANVLTIMSPPPAPPAFWPVVQAVVAYSPASISFTVGLMRGDLNCDGAVDAFDIDPFVLALSDPAGYATQYPACSVLAGDINCDGVLNVFDIDPFVECLTAGCPACP